MPENLESQERGPEEKIKSICEESGVQIVDSVENMKDDGYAYLSIGGHTEEFPEQKIVIFDVSNLLAKPEPEGDSYHAFLRKVSSVIGASGVGGISKENAKVMTQGLSFTGVCFEKV